MASERELKLRRLRRQMKAGASLVLALAAGTFLACQRVAVRPGERSPMGPDARSGPSPTTPRAPDASAPRDANAPAATPDASAEATTDAGLATRDAALATRDAGRNRHHVDVDEHRRGLPVIDNLLE